MKTQLHRRDLMMIRRVHVDRQWQFMVIDYRDDSCAFYALFLTDYIAVARVVFVNQRAGVSKVVIKPADAVRAGALGCGANDELIISGAIK